MQFLMLLLLLTKISTTVALEHSVGSVLFHNRDSRHCWTKDELAKLHARKVFEDCILPSLPPDKINVKYNKNVLKYFRKALRTAESYKDPHTAKILKEALSDTIGGHLRSNTLPNVRFAYYAGYVPYKSVKQLHDFYESIRESLNTQGIGWRPPRGVPSQSNLTVGKILIGAGKPFDPCSSLLIKRYNNNCIRIPPPKVDDENNPTALALPFKSGGFVSLTSPSSENILLNYYTTAARCILGSSPEECRHSDFVNFNNELWHWMKRYVAPHIMDEQLYAAYSGVLRIAAAVQNYGKGLSRRNLYETETDLQDSNWYKLKCMMDKRFYVNTNWTPPLAIMLVLSAAVAMCCLHVLYTYVLGNGGGCHCPDRIRPPMPQPEDVVYAKTDSAFPAMLPAHGAPQNTGFENEETRQRRSRATSQAVSLRTGHTRPGYDENHSSEKGVPFALSDNDLSECLTSSTEFSDDETTKNKTIASSGLCTLQSVRRTPRCASPPKIEAQMAQLKIEKAMSKSPRVERVYRSTTVTASEATYGGRPSDTAWSGSSTSGQSMTTSDTTRRTQTRSHTRSWRSRDQGG